MSYTNMYDHMLNALKGWPGPWALDKDADLEADETIYKGMCIYINASGNFQAGLECGSMPIIAVRNSDGSDVRTSPGNMTGGKMTGIVVTGGYEIETTEFDEDLSYPPNTALTATNTGTDRGEITVGTFYDDTILGVVSDGVVTAPYSQSMLRFWSYFLPPLACPSSPVPYVMHEH